MFFTITGFSDIVLLQYNSTGSLLWTRLTGTSGTDEGSGVSASADGQYIYVTGSTEASLNGQPHAGGDFLFLSNGTAVTLTASYV